MHVPYYDMQPHFEYEILAKTIASYFEMVNHVDIFTFFGGEPLLHKNLINLLEYIMKFSKQFDYLEIVTNGTQIPSDDLLKKLSEFKNKVIMLVDYYGKVSVNVDK